MLVNYLVISRASLSQVSSKMAYLDSGRLLSSLAGSFQGIIIGVIKKLMHKRQSQKPPEKKREKIETPKTRHKNTTKTE